MEADLVEPREHATRSMGKAGILLAVNLRPLGRDAVGDGLAG